MLEDPLDVLSICPSLVTVADLEVDLDGYNYSNIIRAPVVVLAHYSVQEYLTSARTFESKVSLYSIT